MSTDKSWFYERSRWYARWGRDPVEHFLMKLEPEPNSGCWLWTGGVDKDGYGKFQLFILPERKQVSMRAHRFAYALEHGRLPEQNLLHSCDTPACCNPQHMKKGTQAENIADKVRKGRQARGLTHMSVTMPERLARGERHGSRTQPDRVPRGDRNGSRKHPEKLRRGLEHPHSILSEEAKQTLVSLYGQKSAREVAVLLGVKKSTVYTYWWRYRKAERAELAS